MKVLYSNILPMGLEDGQMSVADCLREQSERASSIEIAVGYVSKASLIELDEIIRSSNIRKVLQNCWGGVMDYMKRKNCENEYEKQVRKIIFIER